MGRSRFGALTAHMRRSGEISGPDAVPETQRMHLAHISNPETLTVSYCATNGLANPSCYFGPTPRRGDRLSCAKLWVAKSRRGTMTVRFVFLIAAAGLAGCASATTPGTVAVQSASNATAPRAA